MRFLLGSREVAGDGIEVYCEKSPLGAAILGKKGDTASYKAPNGNRSRSRSSTSSRSAADPAQNDQRVTGLAQPRLHLVGSARRLGSRAAARPRPRPPAAWVGAHVLDLEHAGVRGGHLGEQVTQARPAV